MKGFFMNDMLLNQSQGQSMQRVCHAKGMPDGGLTVLVASCDKYADLLIPFSALWRRFWSDCPYETVLVTESMPLDRRKLCFDHVIACGAGGNWCSRLVQALEQLGTQYVLLLCDDYLLESPVDTELFKKRLAQARDFDAVNLRLIPNPKPSHSYKEGLFEYQKQTAYCIATQAGIWNREFLLALARGKASIWEFERYGSFSVAQELRPLLVTPTKEFPFVDAVHKGYWEKFGVEVCQRNGVPIDFAARGRPPLSVRLREGLKDLVFAVFPWTLIVRIQNLFDVGMKEHPRPKESNVI